MINKKVKFIITIDHLHKSTKVILMNKTKTLINKINLIFPTMLNNYLNLFKMKIKLNTKL